MTIDLDAVRARLSAAGLGARPAEVAGVLADLGHVVSDGALLATVDALRRESTGAGPLDELLRLPGITDVLVNGPHEVWIDRGRGLERSAAAFTDDASVRRLAVRLAALVGRRLDDSSPFVDARLPDGTRVHAVLACVAGQTCLSLRVPARTALTLADWEAGGGLTAQGRAVLTGLVRQRRAVLVTGGTGSGKTTLLASLLGVVDAGERLVIVEDSRELCPDHPHAVRLEARSANAEGAGRVGLTDLVRNALRMRPDRIVVGEVRGAELADLLAALNTGHEGGLGTVHANAPASVPARLEALGALGGLGRHALHAQVAAALDAVVHVRRAGDGRRFVSTIGVVRAGSDGLVRVESALTWDDAGVARAGPAAADLTVLAGA
ncbi:TadA family conjugal transfer-associated ATPase [Propioniciclava soli]|uniref:TadA family conjugal transfer-associated ATPase n=1 Tax=Propioniciclava soli TaxID=2775081 RepID=A0ABZ3CA62_9ACTN|nr:TadA family conjugal transfer-associated ATPase [Propioniciclava soli]